MEVEAGALIEEGEGSVASDFAPALVAVHPLGHSVVVAVGSELRVFDLRGGCPACLLDNSGGSSHFDAIRAVAFSANGALVVSAGDDKLVKIWRTDSWCCVRTVSSEKRVSAVAISDDALYVTFADKFGVVWLVSLDEDGGGDASADNMAVPILGHYCSIITSMKFSPDGRFIATADRDFKIRVTLFPKKPLKGAHEIQSFCLGHRDFVSCISFACLSDGQGFLLSGSGDSTVRLWDYISGDLLDTFHVGDKVAELAEPSKTMESRLAVTGICLTDDGALVAVAIQSFHGVVLLKCDLSAKNLSSFKVITMEKSYIPTSLASSLSAEHLWTVMGASNTPTESIGRLLTRMRIVTPFQRNHLDSADHNPAILEDSDVPGGEKLLSTLQGSLDIAKQEEALAFAAASMKVSMHKMLVKKQYSVEKRELRKRGRNDKKIKK